MQAGASGYPSPSPQGSGQSQSTPDNHPSPSVPSSPSSEPQQDSPSASYSKANNVLPPYFSGSQQSYNSSQYSQNPAYASSSYGTGPPSGQPQYNTGQNPSPSGYSYTGQQPQPSQQPPNYNGQSVPASYSSGPVPSSYTSAYGHAVKMNHSGNFSLSSSMGSQPKSMHGHPHIGRSNSGLVAKKQAFLNKQSINHMGNHDQAEDSEANNVPSDKESGFQSLVYFGSEQSLDLDATVDNLFSH